MRRLTISAALALVILAAPGCKKKAQNVQYVEDGGSQLATAVNVADPRTAIQLLRGFYDLESDSWRWTSSKFAVALRPPKDPAGEGVKLYLDYTVPEVFLKKVPKTTLSVTVDGKPLEPETITTSGSRKYERLVPAELLKGDVVTVEFVLDKFLPPGESDQRELGLIVTQAGLRPVKPAAPPAAPPAAAK